MRLETEDQPNEKDKKFLFDQLQKYNEKYSPKDNNKPLVIFLRDDSGGIKGGITGTSYWDWLNIDTFWIDENYRGKGFGKQLLEMAEKEALNRGCHSIHLDTHDFQSVDFYKKNGYEIAGQLDNLPKGFTRYLLKKKLSS